MQYIIITRDDIESYFKKNCRLYKTRSNKAILDTSDTTVDVFERANNMNVNNELLFDGFFRERIAYMKYKDDVIIFEQNPSFTYFFNVKTGEDLIEWNEYDNYYTEFKIKGNEIKFEDENEQVYEHDYIIDLLNNAVKFSDTYLENEIIRKFYSRNKFIRGIKNNMKKIENLISFYLEGSRI